MRLRDVLPRRTPAPPTADARRTAPPAAPDLVGRTAVVCGGTGEVGEGLVAGLLRAGARVAVPSRSAGRLEDLEARLRAAGVPTDAFVPLVGDLGGGPEAAARLAADARGAAGPPDLVVAALGGWSTGPALADLPMAEWDRQLGDGLRAHQMAIGAFVPLLRGRPGASYVLINGASARYPVAGSAAVSVAAAGLLMTAKVLAAEEAAHGIQVEMLVLGPIATRSRGDAAPWMVRSEQLGALIATRAARRLADPGPAAPATVADLLTSADVGRVRELPPGGVRGARAGAAGWVLWGLQTGREARR